eukprot:scaffold6.g2719.t1
MAPHPAGKHGSGGGGRPLVSRRFVVRLAWVFLLSAALGSLASFFSVHSLGPGAGVALRRGGARQGASQEPLLSQEQLQADLVAARALLKAWPPGKPQGAYFMLTRWAECLVQAGTGASATGRKPRAQALSQAPNPTGPSSSRNKDLDGVKSSMRQLEQRFNERAGYPYIFVNDAIFSQRFRREVTALTRAPCFFGTVPPEQWSYPPFINQTRAAEARAALKDRVPYGGSESYRFMCRYFSGFFFHHPLLDGFEFYWRVEPGVRFFCDMRDDDPFVAMRDRNISYGFNIVVNEVIDTIPGLWATTRAFLIAHPQYVNGSALRAMTYSRGAFYNGCHFWSNLELGQLSFFRGPAYRAFFEALDRSGGFFYERWGDAPVHSLAAVSLLPREAVQLFEIGYRHDDWIHCPQDQRYREICDCDPKSDVSIDQPFCLRQWRDMLASPARPLAWLS